MKSLDELYLSCRDEISKEYINEAINSYKAGCFRASIVASWIALVYDFIGKLRELSLYGEQNAKSLYEKIERYRKSSDVRGSLAFERDILDKMLNEFELLSPVEYRELQRLNDDRNLCAHPSLSDEGIPYQVSSEIARYHIRNVITYVLSRPPVQGKSALNKVMQMLQSSYYPDNEIGIKQFIEESPLGRAKDSLKVSFIYRLIDEILDEENKTEFRGRCLRTLKLFVNLNYSLSSEKFISKGLKLSDSAENNHVYSMMIIASEIPELLENSTQYTISQIKQYMAVDAPIKILAKFYENTLLKDAVQSRVESLTIQELVLFLKIKPINHLMDRLINCFVSSGSYAVAASNFWDYIVPFVKFFYKSQVDTIIDAILNNSQITSSNRVWDYFDSFCEDIESDVIDKERWRRIIELSYLSSKAINIIKSKCPDIDV